MEDKILDNIDLSIIIVTWNNQEEIAECLTSINSMEYDFKFEIIVIDNNSSDQTVKIIKNFNEVFCSDIKLIENFGNLGYTKACNQGISISIGRNILFLNPDIEIIENSLDLLYKEFQANNSISAIAPQLINKNGSIQLSCRTLPKYSDLFLEIFLLSYIFPKSKIFSRWKMRYFSHNETAEVQQPMAAALLVRKDVLDEIQNFDESYYMFFNDVDLCKKIFDRNYKILFYHKASFVHTGGASIFKDRQRMIKAWNNDCLIYFRKYHYNFISYHMLKILLKLTGFIRILLKI